MRVQAAKQPPHVPTPMSAGLSAPPARTSSLALAINPPMTPPSPRFSPSHRRRARARPRFVAQHCQPATQRRNSIRRWPSGARATVHRCTGIYCMAMREIIHRQPGNHASAVHPVSPGKDSITQTPTAAISPAWAAGACRSAPMSGSSISRHPALIAAVAVINVSSPNTGPARPAGRDAASLAVPPPLTWRMTTRYIVKMPKRLSGDLSIPSPHARAGARPCSPATPLYFRARKRCWCGGAAADKIRAGTSLVQLYTAFTAAEPALIHA